MHNQPIQPLSDLETLREENERLRAMITVLRGTINLAVDTFDTEAAHRLLGRSALASFLSTLRKIADGEYKFSEEDLRILKTTIIVESD